MSNNQLIQTALELMHDGQIPADFTPRGIATAVLQMTGELLTAKQIRYFLATHPDLAPEPVILPFRSAS